MIRTLMVAFLLIAFSSPLIAGGKHKPRLRKHSSANQGSEGGRLTPAEKQMIKDVQAKIKADEQALKSGHGTNKKERLHQRKEGRRIGHNRHRTKHTRRKAH